MINYIFNRIKKDLEKGTSNLSQNQIPNILKRIENISNKDGEINGKIIIFSNLSF